MKKSPVKKLPAEKSVVQDSLFTEICNSPILLSSGAQLQGTEVALVIEFAAEEGLSLH